jgi:hypothetical protein
MIRNTDKRQVSSVPATTDGTAETDAGTFDRCKVGASLLTRRSPETAPGASGIIQISILLLLTISCGRIANKNITAENQSNTTVEEVIKEQKNMPETYTEKELKIIDSHIESAFGKCKTVLHEIVSVDIHVDIYVIEPSKKRNYYTLVTVGMGARKMNVPPELKPDKIDRAELLITLPPDWDLNNSDEIYYWPIRWLTMMARLPIEHETWLGWGHTVPNEEPFAENTELCGMLVTMPYYFGEKSASCKLPNKDIVLFYQLVPLYENEMQYKIENGTEALEKSFPDDFDMVVDINRKNLFEK